MGVLLIGEDGKTIGNVSIEEARRLAAEAKKDLVMVSPNVYKLIFSGKLKYDQRQKERNARAQRRTHKIKEVRLRPVTDQHDIDIKTKQIRGFLEKGLKTKVTMQFKGRQAALRDSGLEKMKSIAAEAILGGIAVIDKGPMFEGLNIVLFLVPTK